jgi:hypothetical protein
MDFLVEPGIIHSFLDHAMPGCFLFGLVHLSAVQPGYRITLKVWLHPGPGRLVRPHRTGCFLGVLKTSVLTKC